MMSDDFWDELNRSFVSYVLGPLVERGDTQRFDLTLELTESVHALQHTLKIADVRHSPGSRALITTLEIKLSTTLDVLGTLLFAVRSSLQVDPASKFSGMRSGLRTWHAYSARLSLSWRSSALLLSHEALTLHRGWLPVRPRLAVSASWPPKIAVTSHH
jgi:hypothetical protein